MEVTQFASEVAKREGKKVQVNIAQIMEILKIIRTLIKPMGVDLYTLIHKM